MPSLKAEIAAAEHRHDMRVAALSDDRWANDRRGLVKASHWLMEHEIAELRRRAANDNLSRCTGSVTEFNPLTGMKQEKSK
jgi:hypothetical protein